MAYGKEKEIGSTKSQNYTILSDIINELVMQISSMSICI